MGILIILAALVALMYLAYRGMSLLLLTPLLSLLAVLLSGEGRILANYTQVFMTETGAFIISFFPLFLLGAVFGKLMDASGSARALAEGLVRLLGTGRAIPAVVIACAVMTYGGVSLFVVAFAVYPIAAALFHRAGINKALIPATIALGAFTFTMSALPGSPAIQNAIPMPFFGTTSFAAPGLGTVAAIIMFALGILWLNRRAASARAAGEGYGAHEDNLPATGTALRECAQGGGFDIRELEAHPGPVGEPSAVIALLPVVLVIVTNLVFSAFVIPRLDTAYLAEPLFGSTTIEAVRGVWSVIVALLVAILVLVATNWRRLIDLRTSLDGGANASVLPIFNTASLVGFGAVIAALPVFAAISDAILNVTGGNPLLSVAASVTTLSAMTGSASGGMSIALEALGPTLVDMANAGGVSLEAMHRVTSLASGSLDVLPHSGAVITLLAVCKLSHRESYGDVFMVCCVAPTLALFVILFMASVFGSF